MKLNPTILLFAVALVAMGAAGTIYYETLPGLVIKHPVTGATTATINGTNGMVKAGFFVGDGSGLTGLPSGSAIPGTLVTNGASATAGSLVKFGTRLTNVVDAASADVQATLGQVYQGTNGNLTGWAGVPATSAGVQATLGQVYESTNTALKLTGGTLSGTLGFSGTSELLNLPSLTTAQKNAASGVAGSMVYDSNLGRVQAYDGAAWHSRVRLDGDIMTGDLFVPHLALTNGSAHANLYPGAAHVLDLRNGANAQTFNIYSTYTDASNFSRYSLFHNGGYFNIMQNTGDVAGSGTAEHLRIWCGVGKNIYLSGSGLGGDSWYVEGNTGNLKLATDNAYDVGGSAANRPRSINAATSVNAPTISGGPAVASPGNTTVLGINGTGSDKPGGSLTIEGGQSTGTGRGGGVVMRTSTTSTTGSSANAYQDRARYVPKYIDLTDNTATTLFTVALPATNCIGIEFVCTVQASDGTDFQSLTTPVTVDAVAKTTTITTVVSPTAAQTAVAASSAATLSVTYTVVDNGSNVLAVKATADTSFGSPTYLRAKIVITAINGIGTGWSITEI